MSVYRLPGRHIIPFVATISLVAFCAQSLAAHDGHVLRGALLPRLSPDGGSIVYSYHGSIWRSSREGGEHQQLTANGVVATTIDVNLNPLKIVIDEQVPVARSGWIALRASGPRHPQQPDGTVYGHTSPIYLVVDNERFVSPQDAEYFLDWIDRLRTDIRRRNRVPSRHQITIEELLAEGREAYLDLLNSSKTP